jgi:uncharacterized protein YjaG (DUF416 family)
LKNRYIIKTILNFEHEKDENDELFKSFPNVKCFGIVMEISNCSDLNVLIHQIHEKKFLISLLKIIQCLLK